MVLYLFREGILDIFPLDMAQISSPSFWLLPHGDDFLPQRTVKTSELCMPEHWHQHLLIPGHERVILLLHFLSG